MAQRDALGRPVLPLVCRISATSSVPEGDGFRPVTPRRLTVPVGVHLHRQDRDVAGRRARLVEPSGRKEQHLGIGVVEVEAELVFLVRGVQRALPFRPADAARNVTMFGQGGRWGSASADAVAAASRRSRRQRFPHGPDLHDATSPYV
jgi:hypothetical protein